MILQIFYIVFLMFIWFKTDFFIEYSKLFRLSKLFKIDSWLEYKNINPKLSYLEYIRLKFPNFLVKIITCEYCFLFWIVLSSSIISNNIIYTPMLYIINIVIYKLLWKLVKF